MDAFKHCEENGAIEATEFKIVAEEIYIQYTLTTEVCTVCKDQKKET